MPIIINATNLLGDSLYSIAPIKRFVEENQTVVAIVADRGLAHEMFSLAFRDYYMPIYNRLDFAAIDYPKSTVLSLSAGLAAREASVEFRAGTGKHLHISQGYAKLLGIDASKPISPDVTWQQIEETVEPTHIALSPFSASCTYHSVGKRNKTLEDYKWEHFIRYFRHQDWPLKVIGGRSDALRCSIPINDYFYAETMYELELFLKSSRMLLTIDNGIGHIASALQVPTISLWPPAASIDFIAPAFSPNTKFLLFNPSGAPHESAPFQILSGLRKFTAMILGDSYVETEVQAEREETYS